ncbi:MAG: Crp/Fnr family transcriptional regulator [Clostridiales bacterium]|nr:Crp/Fnr family transcriptional regulator [Clostridiales bacterium]
MDVREFFPFWEALTQEHREDIERHCQQRRFPKGSVIMPSKGDCLGLMMVQSGQFRAFVLSDSGKEVTLYRLYELDICLFSASCIMNNIQFDIHIEAEQDTEVLLMPSPLFDTLMNQSIDMANYANQLMASRFSDVMWTLEQVLFKSMDSRLAQVLLEHARNAQSSELSLTHEILARDLGSAREVVTRLLKYFRDEGLLELTRGRICLLNEARLAAIAG